MSAVDELTTWLRAQLDDDEAAANIIQDGGYLPVAWRSVVHADGSADLFAEVRINYPPDAESEVDEEPFAHVKADRLQHEHIARWDPARVLAEVEAKRQILELHQPVEHYDPNGPVCSTCGERGGPGDEDAVVRWPCPTIRALAQPYADRPGFREEWPAAPDA